MPAIDYIASVSYISFGSDRLAPEPKRTNPVSVLQQKMNACSMTCDFKKKKKYIPRKSLYKMCRWKQTIFHCSLQKTVSLSLFKIANEREKKRNETHHNLMQKSKFTLHQKSKIKKQTFEYKQHCTTARLTRYYFCNKTATRTR